MTEQTSNTTDYGSALRLLWRFIGGRFSHLSLAVVTGVIAGIAEVIPAWAIWQAVSRIALDSTGAHNVELVYRTGVA